LSPHGEDRAAYRFHLRGFAGARAAATVHAVLD